MTQIPTITPDWQDMPHTTHGLRIGLYGGSFNPAHAAHRLVAETALRRGALDQVWWLVTPGNPLKNHDGLASMKERVARARAIAPHPAFKITAYEHSLNTRYACDTIRETLARNRHAHFCWIMGADSLTTFHKWKNWQAIAEMLPIMIIDRPGHTFAPLSAPFAKAYAANRVSEIKASTLITRKAPAWTFLHGPRSTLSSTEVRRRGM